MLNAAICTILIILGLLMVIFLLPAIILLFVRFASWSAGFWLDVFDRM